MLNLNNVTLVAIDGRENALDTFKALKYSCKNINFKKKLFLTSNTENYDNTFCEIKKIKNISHQEYGKFCLTELNDYIDTEYALLIQYDGFVLNHDLWTDDFLKYDYIGAPWTIENVLACANLKDIVFQSLISNKNLYQIGNGGFSLRSKKFLETTKKLYKEDFSGLPEDVVIGIMLRENLELNGIIFPDIITAGRFSCEEENINGQIFSTSFSFGFHGKTQHPELLKLIY